MRRLSCLALGLALSAPASAQGLTPPQAEALHSTGVPAEALAALFGTEDDARALLGAPSAEETVPAETYEGPPSRVLRYALPGGATLTLSVCTDAMRAAHGIAPSFTFCGASVSHDVPTVEAWQAFAFPAQEALRAVADASFGECDTDYFVLGGVLASVQRGGVGDAYVAVVVLEPAR